jgi:hypothetical protein
MADKKAIFTAAFMASEAAHVVGLLESDGDRFDIMGHLGVPAKLPCSSR